MSGDIGKMTIALILAGGSGTRTAQDVPKQFFNVYEKPVIIYTLEAFQKHPDIDGIVVSCLDGWQELLRVFAKDAGKTDRRLPETHWKS